jgi:hypothetical protein
MAVADERIHEVEQPMTDAVPVVRVRVIEGVIMPLRVGVVMVMLVGVRLILVVQTTVIVVRQGLVRSVVPLCRHLPSAPGAQLRLAGRPSGGCDRLASALGRSTLGC